MKMRKEEFGKLKSGETAYVYTISKGLLSATVTDYGASIVTLNVAKNSDKVVDVVLGYDDAAGYENGTYFFGCPVGRNSNRIGGAKFTLNGVEYELDQNDNGNNLHSGLDFYSKRIWNVGEVTDSKISFSLHSPDGDQGYPGNVDIYMTYELTDDNMLKIIYKGAPDKDTIINLTNHSYFNLNGHDSGDILDHEVVIQADSFTKTDEKSIPTGDLVDVTGTPLDFRVRKKIGEEIDADYEANRFGLGYDHNWALNNIGVFQKVAEAKGDISGIVMEVYTDLPGIQLYTGNFIDDEKGKSGAIYPKRAAFCFETQFFPDAINNRNFMSPVIKANEEFVTATGYRFKV